MAALSRPIFSLPELHITHSERAKPFTQRNRKVVEAEMAFCTCTGRHGQKRVCKSTQIHTNLPFHINILPQKHTFLSLCLTVTPSPHQKPSVSICTGPAVRISATEPQHGTALWWCNSLACWHTQAGLNGHRNVRVGVTSALRECLPPQGSFFLLLANSKALQKAKMSCYTPPACPILHNITASDTQMSTQ